MKSNRQTQIVGTSPPTWSGAPNLYSRGETRASWATRRTTSTPGCTSRDPLIWHHQFFLHGQSQCWTERPTEHHRDCMHHVRTSVEHFHEVHRVQPPRNGGRPLKSTPTGSVGATSSRMSSPSASEIPLLLSVSDADKSCPSPTPPVATSIIGSSASSLNPANLCPPRELFTAEGSTWVDCVPINLNRRRGLL